MRDQSRDADAKRRQCGGTCPAVGFGDAGSVKHRAKPDHGGDQAQWIERGLALYVIVKQKARTQKYTNDPNRDVDEEDQPPEICIHEPAAEDRTESGREHQSDAEEPERGPLLLRQERPIKLRWPQRLGYTAAESLQGARC